jgi:hypothetical protein
MATRGPSFYFRDLWKPNEAFTRRKYAEHTSVSAYLSLYLIGLFMRFHRVRESLEGFSHV